MWAKRVIGLVWIVAFCTRLALGEDGSKPEEELLKNMEDKFNAALKESAKKLKVDVDTQAILDEYDIDIGGFQTSKEEVESGPAGVPFVWRLMQDTSRVADKGDCVRQVRQADNLYTKDLHYRAVGRDEFVSIQREVPSAVPGVKVPPGVKYYYLSHCKGYKWSYVPKPKTSTALYVEYPELRDIFTIGQKFYGVFSSALSNEQLHTSSTRADNLKPNVASAICSFSLDDIKATFEGPFKKRDKKTGFYRPFGPEDTISIQPSPHSSDNDRVAEEKAESVKNMTIDFLDPTQPFAEETRHIDLRRHSSRLNFFEEDVYGSRSMWQDVNTQVLLSQAGVVFERVVIQSLADSAILYVATNQGTIYKILTSESVDSSCKLTDRTAYIKWLNNTESMSSIWDNEVYAYLNRTVDKVTFTASFKSDLSMEKEVTFPDDMLLRSDWDCPPSTKTTILSVLTPFGTNKVKIWDMKLVGEGWRSSVVITTDEKVLQIPTVQCAAYKHCTACTNDPFCSWNVSRCALRKDPEDGVEKADCSCTPVNKTGNAGDDLVLPGLGQSLDLRRVQWYKDGVEIEYRDSRVMLAHDSSLILFNLTPSSLGVYELKNVETGECVNLYEVFLTGCQDDACRYRLKYQEWCNEYDQFRLEMDKWYNDYEALGYCSNLLK